MIPTERRQVILSPHCDDAFLALGGYILHDPSKVHVIDIFATCAWTTSPENYSSEELTRINQDEERAVAEKAGVHVTLHEYPEALLRNYRKWNAKKIHPSDTVLSGSIVKTIREYLKEGDRVFFPLAPGHHVDHVILHRQLKLLFDELLEKDIEVFAFEDLPYSWYGGAEERLNRLSRTFTLTAQVIDISEYMDEKVSLLKLYSSQLADSDIAKVIDYAKNLSNYTYSERIWNITKK